MQKNSIAAGIPQPKAINPGVHGGVTDKQYQKSPSEGRISVHQNTTNDKERKIQ